MEYSFFKTGVAETHGAFYNFRTTKKEFFMFTSKLGIQSWCFHTYKETEKVIDRSQPVFPPVVVNRDFLSVFRAEFFHHIQSIQIKIGADGGETGKTGEFEDFSRFRLIR